MSADAIKLLKPRVFDKSKWMQLPRDVVIGHDVLRQLPAVCDDLKLGPSALLVSGKGTMKLAGNTVKKILSDDHTVKTFLAEEITAAGHQERREGGKRRGLPDRCRGRAGDRYGEDRLVQPRPPVHLGPHGSIPRRDCLCPCLGLVRYRPFLARSRSLRLRSLPIPGSSPPPRTACSLPAVLISSRIIPQSLTGSLPTG